MCPYVPYLAADVPGPDYAITIPSRDGTSPIGTQSPNTGSKADTNSTYAEGAFASGVNTQPSTSYTIQNTDYQGIVLFNTASAVAVILNGAVNTNFTCIIINLSTGAITLTPNSGYTVNGGASLALGSGQGVQVFFANRTWLAYAGTTVLRRVPVTKIAVAHQWLASYDATTGLWTQTQPAYSDISGTPAPILSGNSASLGGSVMTVGQTVTATATVTGATTSMVSACSPKTYPGDGFAWDAYISAADTVTVRLTCVLAGTPVAAIYAVRVIQ